jgi:hypothetical protein
MTDGSSPPDAGAIGEAEAEVEITAHETGEQRIARLARLAPTDYDAVRKAAAKALGIRVATLDAEVNRRRQGEAADATDLGEPVVEDLTPYENPVDGHELMAHIVGTLGQFVRMPSHTAVPLAAWCLGTFLMERWTLWPKVLVSSPERRCGKSTMLEVVEGFVFRALFVSSVTASSLLRCIEAWRPTLLIDEADRFLKDNEELNGIINAGHKKRQARVIRSVYSQELKTLSRERLAHGRHR